MFGPPSLNLASVLSSGNTRLEEMQSTTCDPQDVPADHPFPSQLVLYNHGFLDTVSEAHHLDNDPIPALENSSVAFHPFINLTAKSQGKSRVYSKAEWEIKRDIIKTLYWDEGKTLCEVMSIMVKEHDFHATTRMYKARLAKWGFRKNIHEQDVAQILNEKGRRDALGKWSKFMKEGREIPTKRVMAYMRRKKLSETDLLRRLGSATAPSQIICRSPSPVSIKPPQLGRSIEEIAFNVIGQLRAWRESHDMSTKGSLGWEGYQSVTPSTWQLKDWIFYGQRCMEQSECHRGGMLLRKAFLNVEQSIRHLDPITPVCLLQLFHCLRLQKVAEMLVDHLYRLSSHFHPRHPVTRLLHSLKCLVNCNNVQEWGSVLDTFLSKAIPGIDEAFEPRGHGMDDLCLKSDWSRNKCEQQLSQTIVAIHNEHPRDHEKCYDAAAYLFFFMHDTFGWQHSGTLEAALLMVNHAEARLEQSRSSEADREIRRQLSFGLEKLAYCHKGYCTGGSGHMNMRHVLARQMLRSAIGHGIAVDGLQSPDVIRMLERLSRWHQEAENLICAEEVKHQLRQAYALERQRQCG